MFFAGSLIKIELSIQISHFCNMKMLPSKRTWLQILFWGLLWIAIPFFLSGGLGENHERYLYHSLVVFIGTILVIYINVEVLIPTLFLTKKLKIKLCSPADLEHCTCIGTAGLGNWEGEGVEFST